MNEKLSAVLMVLVSVVWVTCLVINYFDKSFSIPPTVHFMMLTIVGAAATFKVISNTQKDTRPKTIRLTRRSASNGGRRKRTANKRGR